MHLSGLLTVVIFLIHDAGGSFGPEVRSSIVGGGDAPVGRWPWVAHLNISNGAYAWRCGGSLLNHEWVLTSANCLDPKRNINMKKSMIWLGAYKLQQASEFYKGISHIILHPDYAVLSDGFLNNIALAKMKTKVTSFSPKVAPVHLPTVHEMFGPRSECWITGWGNIDNGVPLPGEETLQQLKIPIVPPSECRTAYPGLTDEMLCAGDSKGGKDACDGDYGGPLVCRTPRGFVQAGLMSFGNPQGCAVPGFPGVYTRVVPYLEFISNHIHRNMDASAEM